MYKVTIQNNTRKRSVILTSKAKAERVVKISSAKGVKTVYDLPSRFPTQSAVLMAKQTATAVEKETTEDFKRTGFTGVLGYKIGKAPVNANIKIDKLDPAEIMGYPNIVMKDKEGNEVKWVSIDKATGKIIGEGIEEGSRIQKLLMNSKGDTIPYHEVVYYQKLDNGKEVEIQPYEATFGKNRKVDIDKVIPAEDVENYLIESTYQVYGQKVDDDEPLYAIAKDLYDSGKVGIVPVVLRQGFKKYWGLIRPTLHKDKFSVVMELTRAKIQPRELDIPKPSAVKKTKLPTVKVKELFAKRKTKV